MSHELIIADLCKSYGRFAVLKSLNMTVGRGITGLLGANGAGKTTLLRILATVLSADSGGVSYGDFTWRRAKDVRALIGYLPQSFNMYPLLTVREMLTHIAHMKEVPAKNVKREVERVMEYVNLVREEKKRVSKLSGGMLRRLGAAQCLLNDPPILLLDEPTVGLDPAEQLRFQELLRGMAEDKVILLSSHAVSDLETLCGRYAILAGGDIAASGALPLPEGQTLASIYMAYATCDSV